MLAAFLTTILFSISAVCGNRTAQLLGGTEANFWRLCVATAALALFAHGFGDGLSSSVFPIFLLSGSIGFGVGDMALFQALPRLGSRLSVLMTLCLSSPIAALIEWVWLGTGLSAAEIFCGLLILVGVALALAPAKDFRIEKGELSWGLSFGLIAAICQALGAVLSRKAFAAAMAAGENIDGVTAAYQRILGGVAFGAFFLLLVKRQAIGQRLWNRTGETSVTEPRRARRSRGTGDRPPDLTGLLDRTGEATATLETRRGRWRRAWPWIIANGLAGPALGVSCYQWALKTTPTGVVLPVVAITPLVIVPFSYHLEGERPTLRSLAGGLLAVMGAAALAWVATRPK